MNGKLKIYLADLDHFFPDNRISVPLNVGSITSYCKDLYGDALDISLFKHPEDLMQAIRNSPPHILGLSFFVWNTNLSLKVIEYCKKISPSTLTVIGGASVSRITERYKTLLKCNPGLDIVVLDQGEKSFANILNRILSKGFDRKSVFSESIPGCAVRINNSESIARGSIVDDIKGLDKISSPYLMGYFDKFLKAGFLPNFETTRGCPHQCTYCGGGDRLVSKLIVRDENVIYEELRYLLKYSKSREIDLTDTNFGIMGERDLRIISYMADLYEKYKFPYIVGFATSKNKSKVSIELLTKLAKITGFMYFGLQTLTKEVLDNCKRKNISLDTVKELIAIAKKENMPVAVDLIFGLPGETAQSFMESTSKLISLGIQMPTVYQLRLLPGSELAEKEREKYKYSTKFRLFNNRYGEYSFIQGEKPVRIVEVEEIACQNSAFDYKDFLTIREYGFMTSLLVSYGAFTKTVAYLSSRGIGLTKIIRTIQQNAYRYPMLSDFFNDYKVCAEQEFYESEEDLIEKISRNDERWNDLILDKGKYFKIDMGFIGNCLFENVEIFDNIEKIIKEHIVTKLLLGDAENIEAVFRYDKLYRVKQNKEEKGFKRSSIKKEIVVKEQFDYKKWEADGFKGKLSEYKLDKPVQHIYYIEEYELLRQKFEEYSMVSSYHFYERILLYGPRNSFKRCCKVLGE